MQSLARPLCRPARPCPLPLPSLGLTTVAPVARPAQEFENAEGEEYPAAATQNGPDVYVLPLTEVSLPMARQPGRSGEPCGLGPAASAAGAWWAGGLLRGPPSARSWGAVSRLGDSPAPIMSPAWGCCEWGWWQAQGRVPPPVPGRSAASREAGLLCCPRDA